MLKVGLCISGHFRSFERAYPSILSSIIQRYSPDLFIYAPSMIGNDGADRGDKHVMRVPITPDRLTKLFSPKKFIIEPARSWDMSRYKGRIGSGCRNPNMVKGMYYGIYAANQLKREYERENGFIYDVVIRARADLFFESSLERAELENCSHTGGIYFPKFGSYGGLNDQFAFGNSASMDVYADTYTRLDQYFDMGCIWHAETLMKFSMEQTNTPILRSSIKFYILRADGRKFRLLHDPKQGDV
jgi:hypothetical protein